MTNDEKDLIPETEQPSADFDQSDDDLRYAPPAEPPVTAEEEIVEIKVDVVEAIEVEEALPDPLPEDEAYAPPVEIESAVDLTGDSLPVNVTDGLDIEAALAAVSTLSDVIAEQEAVEQVRLARIEAENEALVERQARMDHPERYFPVPPLVTVKRGQLAAIIPAIWLIGLGAWLTFSATTLRVQPDTSLLILIIAVGLGLTLIARWIASRRWASGSLFFGLVSLLSGGLFFFLVQPDAPGLDRGWPLFISAIGLAMLFTRILGITKDRRLTYPAFILFVTGLAGSIITLGLLNSNITVVAASLWPVALVIIVLIWLLPLVFRQRQ